MRVASTCLRPRRVEPLAELTAPVLATDVEMFDAERRDVDGQARPGFVEHRAGQRRAARIGDPRALVDADVEEIAHKTVAIVGTQQRERLAALGGLYPCATVALPTARPPPADACAVSGTMPSCVRTRPISARAGSQSAGA